MKQTNYIVSIKTPCQQNWSQMTESDQGKHCAHCAKNVIDFTQLSDTQILQIVARANGKLCGRFTTGQLNRSLLQTPPPNKAKFYKLISSLLFLSAATGASAHPYQPQTQLVAQHNNPTALQPENETAKQATPTTDSLKNLIRGKAIDIDTKEPIAFATVGVMNTKIGSITDIDGNFSFSIPDSLLRDKIIINANYIGYDPVQFVVNKKDIANPANFVMVAATQILMGDIIMTTEKETTQKKKWWQRKNKS